MSKIARNDPCPCGSGKKYKNCHLKAGDVPPAAEAATPARPSFSQLLATYSSVQLISFTAALQLNPANHGRNVRLENLSRQILLRFDPNDAKPLATWEAVKDVLENYDEDAWLEDPLTNHFTEIAVFEEGNYVVYPGLYVGFTEVLNQLTECIFLHRHGLPEAYVKEVRSATGLLLWMSDSAAADAEQEAFIYEPSQTGHLEFPSPEADEKFAGALFFSKKLMEQVAKDHRYDLNVLQEFKITPGMAELANDDPDENIVNLRPLVEVSNGILLYMPTAICNALINFIYRKATDHGCNAELEDLLYQRQFHLTNVALSKMRWLATTIRLPELKHPLPIQETVFQFDDDKLAYVCFINTGQQLATVRDYNYEKRAEEVVAYLSALEPGQEMRVLALFVLAEVAKDSYFMWSKPATGHQSLGLTFSELKTIAYLDDITSLSLWKFAKCYSRTGELTRVMNVGGVIDAYAVYRNNHGSLLSSDEANPIGGMLMIVNGSADDFMREVQKKNNEHAVLLFDGKQIGYAKVRRHKDYAPVFTENELTRYFRIVIETYKMPVWITSRQTKANHASWATYACDAIAFWLHRMQASLGPVLNAQSLRQFELEVIADPKLMEATEYEVKEVNPGGIEIHVEIDPPRIKLTIPFDFIYLLQLPDNTADKLLMTSVLRGFKWYVESAGKDIALTEELIADIVEQTLRPSQAKMILFSDPTINIKMDDRNLPSIRYVRDTDVSYLLDNLVSYLPEGYVISETIQTKAEKIKLCDDVVTALIAQLTEKIALFNGSELLERLIAQNEKCVQLREFREILIPAKIACFSNLEAEKDGLLDDEKNLVIAAHATRTLIEFVAAKLPTGKKWISKDDLDELLALTNQLTEWGALSESMRMNIDDPKMGLLPSGRIGTGKTLQREAFEPYAVAKTESEIYRNIESFETNYRPERSAAPPVETAESKLLDAAFLAEFNIKLLDLAHIAGALLQYGFDKADACVIISEMDLHQLVKDKAGVSAEVMKVGLDLLTLLERDGIGVSPMGYTPIDIFPWRYNRPISYLRRPLVKLLKEGSIYYYCGYRHISAYFDNLLYLLQTSKLPNAKSAEMKSWLASVSGDKGKPFRNSVKEWFEAYTDFQVISHEIPLEGALGDIDLLVIDHGQCIIYPIECKNISGGRNIHEMKVEMDDYLGRDGKDKGAKVRKHLDRHEWLSANREFFQQFVADLEGYTISSLILTADEIPLAYLKKDDLPLPVKSFVFLRKNGIGYLNED